LSNHVPRSARRCSMIRRNADRFAARSCQNESVIHSVWSDPARSVSRPVSLLWHGICGKMRHCCPSSTSKGRFIASILWLIPRNGECYDDETGISPGWNCDRRGRRIHGLV